MRATKTARELVEMRYLIFLIIFLFSLLRWAEAAVLASKVAPIRNQFHVRYVNGANVYIDGGRNDGLEEGTKLVLKQDPTNR